MAAAAPPPHCFRLTDGSVVSVPAGFARSCSTLRALRSTSCASGGTDTLPPPPLGRVMQRTLALLAAAHATARWDEHDGVLEPQQQDAVAALLHVELLTVTEVRAPCAFALRKGPFQ
jgi:hypothetical protein